MLYSKIEGEGKPFIIIHGFLGMSDNWKTLGLQFAQLGYQIHLLDMRNHGKSFHSDEFNYEIMVEDVKAYLDPSQYRLYSLIWKRTIATQMATAKIANTKATRKSG